MSVQVMEPKNRREGKTMADGMLRDRVTRALEATGYRHLGSVHVCVEKGAVRLCGRVTRFYHKQIATAAALSIDGVTALSNELHVAPEQFSFVTT